MERALWIASALNHSDKVSRFLKVRSLDVNWRNEESGFLSALHVACDTGHKTTTALLLNHPDIDVNIMDGAARTPLMYACTRQETRIVRLLCLDPRTRIDLCCEQGETAVGIATIFGSYEILRWLIASGKVMHDSDLLLRVENMQDVSVRNLWGTYLADPTLARFNTRVELGMKKAVVGQAFALVVFLSDGLLRVTPDSVEGMNPEVQIKLQRFLQIASRLPLELQMVLCHRSYESSRDFVSTEISELAFRSLARKIPVSPPLSGHPTPHFRPGGSRGWVVGTLLICATAVGMLLLLRKPRIANAR